MPPMNPTTIGALWIVFGTLLIAVSDNFVTGVSREMGLWQFHMLRSAMVLPVVALAALAVGQSRSLRPLAPRAVIARSLFSMTGLMMYFAALPAIGIAQAAAGMFTSPVWVAVLSALIFRERIGPRRIFGAGLGFAGVCLVLGVGSEPVRPLALVAVAGGACWALNVIWTRRYCMAESAVCLAVWQFLALFGAGLAGLALTPWLVPMLEGVPGSEFATMSWQPVAWSTAGAVFLIGLAGISAVGCMAKGYQKGEASIMGMFDFSFLFWAPLFAWLIWGDVVGLRIAAGMGLIVIAGALAVWSGAD
jgi:drug/metabolite transporter (DMT)-like permease